MTEQEWLACEDPKKLLAFLRSRTSKRKLRLFAAGSVRPLLQFLVDSRSAEAVTLSEIVADDEKNAGRLAAAHQAAWAVLPHLPSDIHVTAARAAGRTVEADAHMAGELVANEIVGLCAQVREGDAASDAEEYDLHWRGKAEGERCLAALLRDLLGSLPFHPVTIDPTWLAWNNGTVFHLAQAIYDERAFDRMPILADALADAGCHDQEILTHCRNAGPHIRGCWLVDLLLGKE